MDPSRLFVEARDVLQTCGKDDTESAVRVQLIHVLDLPGFVVVIRLHDTQLIDPQMVDAFLFRDEACLMEDLNADEIGVEAACHLKGGNCLELSGFSAPNVRNGRVWGVKQMRMFCDFQSLALCELIAIDEAKAVTGAVVLMSIGWSLWPIQSTGRSRMSLGSEVVDISSIDSTCFPSSTDAWLVSWAVD